MFRTRKMQIRIRKIMKMYYLYKYKITPEIDESKHGCVELCEYGHQLHVHGGRVLMPEVVRYNPRYRLTLYKEKSLGNSLNGYR